MKYKNYWGINSYGRMTTRTTESINDIMSQQVQYLYDYSGGEIVGVFDDYGNNTLYAAMDLLANKLARLDCSVNNSEGSASVSLSNLKDADQLYKKRRKVFEIYSRFYKFKLFEIQMGPVYPVTITIERGIFEEISEQTPSNIKTTDNNYEYLVEDEKSFCLILQNILNSPKVKFIVSEMLRCKNNTNKVKKIDKIVMCEGRTEEIIIHSIAKKLNNKVLVVVSNGKKNIPVLYKELRGKDQESQVLIILDSDGDPEGAKKEIVRKIGETGYELAILNNSVEDWFGTKIEGFSKLKLLQEIDSVVDKFDFAKLMSEHESFNRVVSFISQ